ncbi:MAG: DUF3392 family protein, partial [Verrucomicrobiota bacterium]
MNVITDFLEVLADWIKPHLFNVSFAVSATLLVVYGSNINRAVKNLVKKYHVAVRLTIFIAVCSFGYGALTVLFTWALSKLFTQLGDLILFPSVVVLFVVIGVLAERKNQI